MIYIEFRNWVLWVIRQKDRRRKMLSSVVRRLRPLCWLTRVELMRARSWYYEKRKQQPVIFYFRCRINADFQLSKILHFLFISSTRRWTSWLTGSERPVNRTGTPQDDQTEINHRKHILKIVIFKLFLQSNVQKQSIHSSPVSSD